MTLEACTGSKYRSRALRGCSSALPVLKPQAPFHGSRALVGELPRACPLERETLVSHQPHHKC